MNLKVPELSLVVLVGASGSGKSTFARKHFKPTEVISSDYCRGLVSDDENDQSATRDAFELLHFIVAKRLSAGRLTVVDATNVQAASRKPLVELARQHHVLPVAIVFALPESLCHERNRGRADRTFGPHVVRNQSSDLRRSIRGLDREGFRYSYTLGSTEEVEAVSIERQPLWNNRKEDHGPFDIIGDVHGCFEELCELLGKLGYSLHSQDGELAVTPPPGRKAIFLGDLVDRGPGITQVLRLAMNMTAAGHALCVPGNHDIKLLRKLRGKNVQITHGLADSLAQLENESPQFASDVAAFLDGLVGHYVLDGGNLVVAHAGLKEELQGRSSGAVREFALFGETTGETDEFGLPVRSDWAARYRGRATVVYGHTPVPEPEWVNNTVNIDTGCVFGGRLTALRYPEKDLVSVPAQAQYYAPAKPFLKADGEPAALSMQQQLDDLLDIEDVLGKRIIATRLQRSITIREENAAAALEAMSRFAVNPKWLIYLPPTMSPSETSRLDGFLEHPEETFAYFRNEGVGKVVCEQKHMGSRAVVVLCRDEDVAVRRFGVTGEGLGVCFTRTGRRFFSDPALEVEFLNRLGRAIEVSGLWEELQTDWICLDCELMPWSAKAQQLLRSQYAATGSAARHALAEAVATLQTAAAHNPALVDLKDSFAVRFECAERYVEAYRRYCWPVESLNDYKLAPFHILASEGTTHINRDHVWHMDTIARICAQDEAFLLATPYLQIATTDTDAQLAATNWWNDLTESGGEGMVVKPDSFLTHGPRGVVQPALKCRGREYLRIIYGPEYTLEGNLSRLRKRGLAGKRSLALREFALGVEALERFVRREPLRRVHECVFGVLALESEPVDPRL